MGFRLLGLGFWVLGSCRGRRFGGLIVKSCCVLGSGFVLVALDSGSRGSMAKVPFGTVYAVLLAKSLLFFQTARLSHSLSLSLSLSLYLYRYRYEKY